jgi:hypothetical protein
MFSSIKNRRPSASMAVATIAVILAGAGSAAAGSLITSAQVQNNSLKSVDVKNKSLKLRDLGPGARTKLKGETGPQGPQGEPGQGGSGGPAAISGYEQVSQATDANGSVKSITVECPAGKKALSAGASVPVGSAFISNIRVSEDGNAATVAAADNPDNGNSWALTGRVVCADAG